MLVELSPSKTKWSTGRTSSFFVDDLSLGKWDNMHSFGIRVNSNLNVNVTFRGGKAKNSFCMRAIAGCGQQLSLDACLKISYSNEKGKTI